MCEHSAVLVNEPARNVRHSRRHDGEEHVFQFEFALKNLNSKIRIKTCLWLSVLEVLADLKPPADKYSVCIIYLTITNQTPDGRPGRGFPPC